MAGSLPIVFIPGASSDETVWNAQMNYFAGKTQAVAVNLTRFDSVQDMADQILRAAPREFAVCGTSMGGYVALDVLKKANGRVKKAVFCNTSARTDTEAKRRQRRMEVDAGEDAWLRNREDLEHYKVFLSERSFRNADLVRRLQEISRRVGFGCFSRHQQACSTRPDSVPFLKDIDMPVLIIGGMEDGITPPELQAEMHAHIRGSSLAMLPDVGHIAHMEAPERVIAEIDAFLAAA